MEVPSVDIQDAPSLGQGREASRIVAFERDGRRVGYFVPLPVDRISAAGEGIRRSTGDAGRDISCSLWTSALSDLGMTEDEFVELFFAVEDPGEEGEQCA
jgi:hypothetical protein